MPTHLTDLSVTKVALCGKGMNPEAEVMLFKSAVTKTTTSELSVDLEEAVEELLGVEDVWIRDVSLDEGWFVYSSEDNDFYQMSYTLANGSVTLEGQPTEVECVTSYEPIAKAAELRAKQEVGVADETITKADHDAVVAERDALKTELDALKVGEPDAIDKSALPEAVQKALDEAEILKADVAALRAESRAREFIAKAGDEKLPTEYAPVLEAIDRLLPEELRKTHDRVIKALSARADLVEVTKELGSDTEGVESDPAEALIGKYVADGMPRYEAITKAMAEKPELYPASR